MAVLDNVADVADDFRVTATLADVAAAGWLTDRLRLHRLEADARERLGGGISVSGEDAHLFLYANSAEAAQEAEKVVQSILAERNLSADFAFDRWHPIEERWEDAANPVPMTAAERAAEHERLEEEETAQSQASGHAEWEVRVEMPTHHDAAALADRLQGEGHQPVRRWKYLVIGANDEDDAHALAKTIEAQSADAKVTVEPGYGMVQEATRGTVFAVFG